MDLVVLRSEIVRDEGVRLFPYRDTAGNITIGIGRNLSSVGVSSAEVQAMWLADVDRATAGLDRALPWWRTLSEDRQRVLVNMAFNMGVPKLLTFKRMLAAVKDGQYQAAADEMLDSEWSKQVVGRATRLAKIMAG